ncbi:hypothetical protein D3872_24135 [Massilia cavernae]|uniref:Cationic amino acid transporter C-terminal domain-containing protein n=1 Tax=Massilia cavernae TaxID=2320864 RepID=A0A418X7C0_9BURK|nr:hypothetical protein D3872_24135 [Massilia cavernae]
MSFGQTRIIFAMARDGLLPKRLATIHPTYGTPFLATWIVGLRKKRPDLHRAFRCPGVPYVPALAIVACVALMTFLSKSTWIAFGIWLVLGLAVYFIY